MRERTTASCPAPLTSSRTGRPCVSDGVGEATAEPRVELDGGGVVPQRPSRVDAARGRDPLGLGANLVRRLPANAVVGVTHVQQHPRLARDDVPHVRGQRQRTDRRDQARRRATRAARPRARPPRPRRARRDGRPWAASPRDPPRPCSVIRARVCPAIARDDPDGKPFPLEHGPLLDVDLDVAGELGRRRRDGHVGVATRVADRVAERDPRPVDDVEPRAVEAARVGGRAEVRGPEASALLVGERDDLERAAALRRAATRSTTASAASTPSGPSYRPASGTVSMCEPSTSGGPAPTRPITLPTASRRTVSPASSIHVATRSPARASAGVANPRVRRPSSSLIAASSSARASTSAAVPVTGHDDRAPR